MQIFAPLGPVGNNERAEFDVVQLGNATRMYVGVGGGTVPDGPDAGTAPDPVTAQFLRSDSVRTGAPAAFTALTNLMPDTPGYSSFGYCDPQCVYDNYVYVPPGAGPDTVYLSGDNEYSENNWGPNSPFCCPDDPATGRSNGRGVLLSTNAGAPASSCSPPCRPSPGSTRAP